jgi:hypothetical protein
MNPAVKAVFLSLLLATPSLAHAQTRDQAAAVPQEPTHYSDGEIQNILDWERLVAKANDYRQRKAAEEAARRDASSTRTE